MAYKADEAKYIFLNVAKCQYSNNIEQLLEC